MQQSINNFFAKIFGILTTFLAAYVTDPGTRWGLAIIIFTLIFNIIVFPLNWKTIKNSKKMAEIQPQLKELQEKYKNDPQKMQAEQQKLFKENNVNMLGGCLPMLIQWPLFMAMFYVFRELSSNGTLSGLSFMAPLVNDLSLSKNIPLTVLTVVTMLLTQWVTQLGQKNAQQQGTQMLAMTVMMSLMMAYFTFTQPAALGLYWVTNNVFRLIQQLVLNYVDKRNSEAI